MEAVNMLDAKTHLSRLVDALESGQETEIVIARHGRPVARLVALDAGAGGVRLGMAKGQFEVPEDIDAGNDEVAALFRGDAT